MARRRAGLTQRELAERIGCRQATIARWERGDRQSSFEDVQVVAGACGLQLDAHLVPEDRSWWPQIAVQLGLEPAQRVRRLTPPGGFDVVDILEAFADAQTSAVVIGEVAGALDGWPLVLSGHAIEVCVKAAEGAIGVVLERLGAHDPIDGRYELRSGGQLVTTEVPPGTSGLSDIARGAEFVGIGGGQVRVASVIDLLRMAEASPDPGAGREGLAYQALLEVQRTRHNPRAVEDRTEGERIRAWMSQQTPVA